MGFFRIPRGMPTVTSGINNLTEFIGVVAIWRPKPEVETTDVGRPRIVSFVAFLSPAWSKL